MAVCGLEWSIVAVCERTQIVLQTMDLKCGNRKVVCLVADPGTGMVATALSNGVIRTFVPEIQHHCTVGRCSWRDGPKVLCQDIFYQNVVFGTNIWHRSSTLNGERDRVIVSLGSQYKLLVGHRDQLAVFDVSPSRAAQSEVQESELVWTTRFESVVLAAAMSGDCHSLAVVLADDGSKNDSPCGVRMFFRDEEDGTTSTRAGSEIASDIGVVFKPGTFLVHQAPVIQASFRGLGCVNSGMHASEGEPNDLLLTYCREDCSVRIFSQNSWKQLIVWTTPRNTRVDWVRGLTAMNVSDLEPRKPKKQSASVRHRTRSQDLDSVGATSLVGGRAGQLSSRPSASSGAGAWVAEVTFQTTFPALRLSRLSYMKRGADDTQPAHVESLAAVLPAGSLSPDSVMDASGTGFVVQGIWPSWHSWISEGVKEETGGTIKGSAMSFLGLGTSMSAASGLLSDHQIGSTHSPPGEIRLLAPDPASGKVVVMEIPLWGDQEFGATQVGSPLRYVLALDQINGDNYPEKETDVNCEAFLPYESGFVCARTDRRSESIALIWRRGSSVFELDSVAGNSEHQACSKSNNHASDGSTVDLVDTTSVLAPLWLPELKLPKVNDDYEVVVAMHWWPDEPIEPPHLLVVSSAGNAYVFEIPPPWSAVEPPMPANDPFSVSATSSTAGSVASYVVNGGQDDTDSDEGSGGRRKNYEVMITPDPDFGIGLRLEAQVEGMAAVAGSYKKHPLSGGKLPAERTGMIVLGDELLSVNGVTLEGLSFDDIIATVRKVGGRSAPGSPLCMKFRPRADNVHHANDSARSVPGGADTSERSSRRTREQILGISPKTSRRQRIVIEKGSPMFDADETMSECDSRSHATMLVGAKGESQQQFSRIVASMKGILPTSGISTSTMVLLPWHPTKGVAVIIGIHGGSLFAKRLELLGDTDRSGAVCVDLGSTTTGLDEKGCVIALANVKNSERGWYVATCDGLSGCTLIFVAIEKAAKQHRPSGAKGGTDLRASFQQIFTFGDSSCSGLYRAYSMEWFATLSTIHDDGFAKVTVWQAEADTSIHHQRPDYGDQRPCIEHDVLVDIEPGEKVVDIRFDDSYLPCGMPRLVVLTNVSVSTYRKYKESSLWEKLCNIRLSDLPTVGSMQSLKVAASRSSPVHLKPHLLHAAHAISPERHHEVQTDWNASSLLSILLSEENGLASAFPKIQLVMDWLARQEHLKPRAFDISSESAAVAPLNLIFESDDTANTANVRFHSTSSKSHGETDDKVDTQHVLFGHYLAISESAPNTAVDLKPHETLESHARLRNMRLLDCGLVWAIGEALKDPRSFNDTDSHGQLASLCILLLRRIKAARAGLEESTNSNVPARVSMPGSFYVKRQVETKEAIEMDPQIASAGCFAALISNRQDVLLEQCRVNGSRFDWDTVKQNRLSFWIRSDERLRKVAVEVGQQTFKASRDVMECALFFVAAGNIQMLKNLAATDQKGSGRKFLKFLTDFDFSSPRGRKAAEKNAYSLLRKHQYKPAATFFLLAQPPMLRTALETIVTKTHDLDLAFLVARLVESKKSQSQPLSLGGSIMGGGFGYASIGQTMGRDPGDKFESWTPEIGPCAKRFLQDRGMPAAQDDACLQALQLVWLEDREQAEHVLARTFPNSPHLVTKRQTRYSSGAGFTRQTMLAALSDVISEADSIVGFLSRPFLLEGLHASPRARWAAILKVTGVMLEYGMNLPCALFVLRYTHVADCSLEDHREGLGEGAPAKASTSEEAVARGGGSSSIFDDYEVPRMVKQKDSAGLGQTGQAVSSIFDSFEMPVPAKSSKARNQTHEMTSSIFDSFDVPSPRQVTSASDSGTGPEKVGAQKLESSNVKTEGTASAPLCPAFWLQWRNHRLLDSAARRLVCEIMGLVDIFSSDINEIRAIDRQLLLNPHGTSAGLAFLSGPCNSESLLAKVRGTVEDVSSICRLEMTAVMQRSLDVLDPHKGYDTFIVCVLLHTVMNRAELAEEVVREVAVEQIQRCNLFALATSPGSPPLQNRSIRRQTLRSSWYLEICLWLHRGGLLSLCGLTEREAIVAVRLGWVVAHWEDDMSAIEDVLRHEPDCPLDFFAGRQIWSCSKFWEGMQVQTSAGGSSGGGWEFLVDCRREEATKMLRNRPPGSFILRPHVDDKGVFTLSFKTNLRPASSAENGGEEPVEKGPANAKPVKKDDVVQHAIIRLSDAGFRCGSFGPFASLMRLLEAVSSSLPFDLLFDKPPLTNTMRSDDSTPSPNSLLLRTKVAKISDPMDGHFGPPADEKPLVDSGSTAESIGDFAKLVALSDVRRQLCAVVTGDMSDGNDNEPWFRGDETKSNEHDFEVEETGSLGSVSTRTSSSEERFKLASRIVRPLLGWCRALEMRLVYRIAPDLHLLYSSTPSRSRPVVFDDANRPNGHHHGDGDNMIRRMIQPNSGIEFRTLRVGEGGDTAMVVLCSRDDVVKWLLANKFDAEEPDAVERLSRMEASRVIEQIAMSDLSLKVLGQHFSRRAGEGDIVCYRFVDPWEVEVVENREGETKAASVGRDHYVPFSVDAVSLACMRFVVQFERSGMSGLWEFTKGALRLTKAIASVHPPWERDSGGDILMNQGEVIEPSSYENSIRRHHYRNALFTRLDLPQRFLALIQVELLDLKNLNSPSAGSVSVYALLRLKRPGSSAPLTHKARTLDSAVTQPVKIGKSSGPNAPASWGSLVRFRFPLPEGVFCDGRSFDEDREALFKGPPCILQLSVYEKKFMSETELGGADVELDALTSGGQLEEWVPLRSAKEGINWFARVRLTLRFELMCLQSSSDLEPGMKMPESVGLARIKQLSKLGGTYEDSSVRRSASTPDLLSYFESMVY